MSTGDNYSNDFVMMRVPRQEYAKIQQLKDTLQQNPDYSWVAGLAVGAFVGLAVGLLLDEISSGNQPRKPSARRK